MRACGCDRCKPGKQWAWFAIVKLLVKIYFSNSIPISEEEKFDGKEVAFVQHFDIVEQADEIDQATGCINIQLARAHEICNAHQQSASPVIDPRKWYSFGPANAILGTVSVVPANDTMKINESTETWSVTRSKISQIPWFHRRVYVD